MSAIKTFILVIFLLIATVALLYGVDLRFKESVKLNLEKIPTVISSPKALGSKSRSMSSPGTIVDSTYYDWQANGGLDDHLVLFDDNGIVKIHATWTTAHRENLNDRCQAVYNCWSGNPHEEDQEKYCVFPPPSGHGSLSTRGGSLVVCSSAQIDSLFRVIVAEDAFPCIMAYSFYEPPREPVGLRPRITVNTDNSSVITSINTEVFNGISSGVMWDHGFDIWHHFSDIAPDWMDDDMEPPTIHSGTNGKVGVVIPDIVGSIRLFESTDYGETFDVMTIAGADTADLPAGLDSTAARLGWINSDIIYVEDEPHVVWTAGQGAKIGDQYGLFDFKATIFHWSPSTGIDTVVVASTQSTSSIRGDYVPTPWNHLSVDWPSIGLAVDGQTLVVAYTALSTEDIDSTAFLPTGYLDIWMTASPDNGENWSDPQNVTNPDGSILGWDDRYPSVAKKSLDNSVDPGKDVYLIYQSDDLAGTLVQGWETTINLDYVKFLGVDLLAVGIGDEKGDEINIPSVAMFSQNYPNPFNPFTTIDYQIARETHVILKIFDLRGRLVRTLIDEENVPGRYSVQWDGRAAAGHFAPSGVYFCRMETAGEANTSRKMLLLK